MTEDEAYKVHVQYTLIDSSLLFHKNILCAGMM